MSILDALNACYSKQHGEDKKHKFTSDEMIQIFGEDFERKLVVYEQSFNNTTYLLLFFEENKWHECYIYEIKNNVYSFNYDLINNTLVRKVDEKTIKFLQSKITPYENSLKLIRQL